MHHSRASFVLGCVLALLAAAGQDDDKKKDDKKSSKSVDVHLKVSVKGAGTLPSNTKAEVSGGEAPCGALSSNDVTAIIEQGEAVFSGLPVCNVTIKVTAKGYLPWKAVVDLAGYKAPITAVLEPEQ
jgi:hypothetical protein